MSNTLSFQVLELYSGIGGMHYALTEAKVVGAKVVAAVDISPLANSVYCHNFPNTLHFEKGIEGLSVKDLNELNFNVLLMSPPCQPFTRIGLKKDLDDPRSKSFLHLLSVLPRLKRLPSYILLENVKGFEESQAHKYFCNVLDKLSYDYNGFLISPKHMGIPNSRLRYYLLAKHRPLGSASKTLDLHEVVDYFLLDVRSTSPLSEAQQGRTCSELKNYLEGAEPDDEDCEVPDHVIDRYLSVMDIVNPSSTGSTCFTKSYGHYIEGTGSILNVSTKECDDLPQKGNPKNLQLRYFTPREIANLMGFPKDTFTFPPATTRKQRYRLLGNSLNVSVVACLLKFLLNSNKTSGTS